MQVLKIVPFCLMFILSSCGPQSNRAKDSSPHLFKMDSARGCINENPLMATGIIGGQKVQKTDPDSNLAVLIMADDGICTASAIRDNVLLTAAHCFNKDKVKSVSAIFYPSISCESGYDKRIHSIPAMAVVVNEDFNPNVQIDKTSGDVALIFLSEKIPSGYPVHKLADPLNVVQGNDVALYGYGRTNSNGGGSGVLRKINLSSSRFAVDEIGKRVIIDQSGGQGVCNGDSGGASLVKTVQGETQILGVTSYVQGREDDVCGSISVQSLAISYSDWINRAISAHSGEGSEGER